MVESMGKLMAAALADKMGIRKAVLTAQRLAGWMAVPSVYLWVDSKVVPLVKTPVDNLADLWAGSTAWTMAILLAESKDNN